MKVIYIRVTEEQKEQLQKAADKAHLPLTTWVRITALNKADADDK